MSNRLAIIGGAVVTPSGVIDDGVALCEDAEAIKHVGPFWLDVCRGVRTDGRLDETRLRKFFDSIESAPRA